MESRPLDAPDRSASAGVADPHRLAALRDLELLDTPSEQAFDRLTQLAVSMLDVPMAAVSLVDEDRQFFKSCAGMPPEIAQARETPLEGSHCRHVVDRGAPLVIEDTRWELLAAGTSPVPAGTRAYAGAPLTTPSGHVLGAFCVMDRIPRKWSRRELDFLEALAASVMSEIELHAARLRDRRRGEQLENERTASLERANGFLVSAREDLSRSREETIWRLAGAIEARNAETGAHSNRMGVTCALLAERMGIDPDGAELIRIAGPLHDVGKLAIPDIILNKAGPLSASQRRVIETHAEIGHRMLAGSEEPLLELAALMALTHHERVDGRGYPGGLRGGDIPIEGRIAAVADVFDALTNDRVWRPAFRVGEAIAMMDAGRGTQFDPPVFDCLRDGLDQILAAAEEAGARGSRGRHVNRAASRPPGRAGSRGAMTQRDDLGVHEAAAKGELRREVDARTQLDADQTAADLDQTQADSDQAASDADQLAADTDQTIADRDQHASDRDQAAADWGRSHAGGAASADQAYQASRVDRDEASEERDSTTVVRSAATSHRLAAAAQRDEVARVRDLTAALRDRTAEALDRAAEARDRAAEARERDALGAGGVDDAIAPARARRALGASVRQRAARERIAAAADREAAAADRRRAAADRRDAGLDELTGVFRRGTGELALNHEMDRARRSGRPLVLAMIDVDALKAVNDEHGHAAGDALLRDVPTAIIATLRSYDVTVRWGGDEFVCALSDVSLEVASERLAEIQRALSELNPGASISAGLAERADEDTLESLIARADADLYRAKEAMRTALRAAGAAPEDPL